MSKFKIALLSLAVLTGVLSTAPVYVGATPATEAIRNGYNDAGGDTETISLPTRIKGIVNLFLFIIGAVAVIMIIVGGLRYTISHGDSSQIKAAKDTILYAVVGLVVAILAYAIVNFVLTSFK
jgi:hypothetical protein